MCELVGQQAIGPIRARLILALAEDDVPADGVSAGIDRSSRLRRLDVVMNPEPGDLALAGNRGVCDLVQRFPRPKQDPIHHLGSQVPMTVEIVVLVAGALCGCA